MDIITHFLAAVLVARWRKYKHNQFETCFMGIAGGLPDIDSIAAPWGFHGTYTHTILIGMLLAVVYAAGVMHFGHQFMTELQIPFRRLIGLAMGGVLLHLVLDLDTLS